MPLPQSLGIRLVPKGDVTKRSQDHPSVNLKGNSPPPPPSQIFQPALYYTLWVTGRQPRISRYWRKGRD